MKNDAQTGNFLTHAAIEQRVCALVADNLGLEIGRVTLTSSFRGLGADMLDFYSIMLDLEIMFGLPIPDGESRRFVVVGDVVVWMRDQQHEHSDRSVRMGNPAWPGKEPHGKATER